MSIVVKDKAGEHIFSLTNFVNKGIEHPVIEYEFYFIYNGFETKLILDAELFDLEDLLKGLMYINNNLKGECYFEPVMSGRMKIKFGMTDQGHLDIDGFVYDASYSIKLSFKFLSDQSFLSDLISGCTITIASLTENLLG